MPGSSGCFRVSKKRVNARHVQVSNDVRRGGPCDSRDSASERA